MAHTRRFEMILFVAVAATLATVLTTKYDVYEYAIGGLVIIVTIVLIYAMLRAYNRPHETKEKNEYNIAREIHNSSRFVRTLYGDVLDLDYYGSAPSLMFLSDGGHLENLGLMEVLKRKRKRIVVFNGELDDPATDSLGSIMDDLYPYEGDETLEVANAIRKELNFV